MLDDTSLRDARLRLQAALSGAELSDSARAQARRLLERLEAGVRILVLGPSSVGKSWLSNALVQQCCDQSALDVSRMFYADQSETNETALIDEFPASCRSGISSDLLGRVVLVDVHVIDEYHLMPNSIARVTASADVVIWCTQEFSPEEAEIWAKMPDGLKDHSFLVLTKADLQPSPNDLADLMSRLQDVASEEFHSFFPTTTLDTERALRAGYDLSDQLLATSGVKALRKSLKDLIEAGCRADLDSAVLFLERTGLSETTPLGDESIEDRSAAETTPLDKIHEGLVARAYDLAEMVFDEARGDMTDILASCLEITDELAEVVSELGMAVLPSSDWQFAFESASETVMLLASENDTHAAADAVLVLLQLRRDIEHMQLQKAA